MTKKQAKKQAKLNPLYKRAKKAGVTKEQMDSFPDDEARKAYLDRVSPQTNPDARPKEGTPKPAQQFEPMPDKFEFDSKLEAQFIMTNRIQFDENNMQAKLREINRKYGPGKPVKIVKTMTFKPVKGVTKDKLSAKFLITHFVVFMK